MICPLCQKSFSSRRYSVHLANLHSDAFQSKNEMDLFAIKHRLGLTDECIESIVSDYKSGISALQIKQKRKVPYKIVQNILIATGVQIRDERNAALTQSVRERFRDTCKKKYGVENVSQVEEVKNRKLATFQSHYGVDNIFCVPDFPEHVSNVMLAKFGKKRHTNGAKISKARSLFTPEKRAQILQQQRASWSSWERASWSSWDDARKQAWSESRSRLAKEQWSNLSEEERKYRIKKWLDSVSKNGYHSFLESRIAAVLTLCGIPYKHQFWLRGTYYDFLLWDALILEVHGDYWHANPTKYKDSDILVFPQRQIPAFKIWKKDAHKLAKAKSSGYKFVAIWETDINRAEKLGELQKWLLGVISESIKN